MDLTEAENLGKKVMGDTTFVSVAGVWERLGYSGIKLSL